MSVDWRNVETILLDMDGTVLDLAFDNHFWLGVVPSAYGERHGLSTQHAWSIVKERYDRVAGHLNWYCLDYWTTELGLDIRALKEAHRHLIGYLPGAVGFLERARALGKRLALVTNAHPDALSLKLRQTRLDKLVGPIVSSHRLGFAKEDARFWPQLASQLSYDIRSSLLIEDSAAVLRAGSAHGLKTLIIRCPDTQRPRRDLDALDRFAAIDGLAELMTTMDAGCTRAPL